MDIETDEEYQGLQEMLDINRELLQIHRKRLTGMGLTEVQMEIKMAPLSVSNGIPFRYMPSGASHDAMNLVELAVHSFPAED